MAVKILDSLILNNYIECFHKTNDPTQLKLWQKYLKPNSPIEIRL